LTPAGRAAIVTGGAGGLGIAVARRLLAAGVAVSLWDRDADALAALDLDVHCRVVDVTEPGAVSRAMAETTTAIGPVSLAVANAGVLGPVAPVWEWPAEAFERVLRVNLTGVFHLLQAVVPPMLAMPQPRAGRIVTIASIQGKEGTALSGAYGASKAGLIALTKTLGKELASTGILANCIAPSAVETAMARSITPERRAELTAKIPLGRFLDPDEVAAMTMWLLSTECSFSTGAVFDLSGGRATY
jgi:2-dehydro-3-deoxy-L-rhamnonate dehydrogenase (NAD+)